MKPWKLEYTVLGFTFVLYWNFAPLQCDSDKSTLPLAYTFSTTATWPAEPRFQQMTAPTAGFWPRGYLSLVLPQKVFALFMDKLGLWPVISYALPHA